MRQEESRQTRQTDRQTDRAHETRQKTKALVRVMRMLVEQ